MQKLRENNLKPDWNIGYTTQQHLCIDLDNTTYYKVRCLVNMLMKNYTDIGDCVIMRSSTKQQAETWIYKPIKQLIKKVVLHNYHLIFNNLVGYERCCHVIETLAHLGVINEEYVKIREMRNDMTLRVSETVNVEYVKPKPVFIEYIQNPYCKKDGKGIYLYARLRRVC